MSTETKNLYVSDDELSLVREYFGTVDGQDACKAMVGEAELVESGARAGQYKLGMSEQRFVTRIHRDVLGKYDHGVAYFRNKGTAGAKSGAEIDTTSTADQMKAAIESAMPKRAPLSTEQLVSGDSLSGVLQGLVERLDANKTYALRTNFQRELEKAADGLDVAGMVGERCSAVQSVESVAEELKDANTKAGKVLAMNPDASKDEIADLLTPLAEKVKDATTTVQRARKKALFEHFKVDGPNRDYEMEASEIIAAHGTGDTTTGWELAVRDRYLAQLADAKKAADKARAGLESVYEWLAANQPAESTGAIDLGF